MKRLLAIGLILAIGSTLRADVSGTEFSQWFARRSLTQSVGLSPFFPQYFDPLTADAVQDAPAERPAVNLPPSLRESNYWRELYLDRGGALKPNWSCVHATVASLFRWQGRDDLAERWLKSYSGGETYLGLTAKLDREGVVYADTFRNRDVAFLEWSVRTRRGCGVGVTTVRRDRDGNVVSIGYHMLALVHLDATHAGLLDNNGPPRVQYVPREAFLENWLNHLSWAVTPAYSPAPPLPLPLRSSNVSRQRRMNQDDASFRRMK